MILGLRTVLAAARASIGPRAVAHPSVFRNPRRVCPIRDGLSVLTCLSLCRSYGGYQPGRQYVGMPDFPMILSCLRAQARPFSILVNCILAQSPPTNENGP